MIYAIGAFDGFHLGHRRLLHTAAKRAAILNLNWGVMTFLEHPQQLFAKDTFKFLFTQEERDILVKYNDIPFVEKIPFTHALSNLTPEGFFDFITKRCSIDGLVAGDNFRFARARSGDVDTLRRLCASYGMTLDIVKSHKIGATVTSSTAIREAVLRGQMECVFEMLGTPFLIRGRVIKGEGRGRGLGYPTANVTVKPNKVYPARGIYSTLAFLENKWFGAAVNIGYNPTFEGIRELRCEAHIIGYSGDIYNKTITLFPLEKEREEMKFTDSDSLVSQIQRDINHTKATANRYLTLHDKVWEKFEDILLVK